MLMNEANKKQILWRCGFKIWNNHLHFWLLMYILKEKLLGKLKEYHPGTLSWHEKLMPKLVKKY